MTVRLLSLDEIEGQPVGGKAAGLARLREMGLKIPETLILVGARPGHWPADLDARVAELGEGALAVRSSAIGEDGRDASFAGQYETVLDVRGGEALRRAIDTCLASGQAARALAYREARAEDGVARESDVVMSIVIQEMVDARASGVCFSADPVTHRRNRLVIDAVAGVGEALVSGQVGADHDELLRRQMRWEVRQSTMDAPVLSEHERMRIASEAIDAETRSGEPLDLEWALDRTGALFWLQARPITTLGLDPQELDTLPVVTEDVFTRCNVGEMMPGAIAPLTFSTCARGIDVGWQMNMAAVGLRSETTSNNVYVAMSHGHLFINLSEGARFSAAVTGASPDEQSLAICGRLVPEVVAPAPPPLRVRLPRMIRQISSVLRPGPRIRRLETLLEQGAIAPGRDAYETWQAIDARMGSLFEAYALHLTISSGAGALAPILLRVMAGDAEPTDRHHAVVAHLFAGAEGVESADIAQGAERVLDALVDSDALPRNFQDFEVEEAVAWLEMESSGEAGRLYRDYLRRHGHRSLRELDIRQPEWAYDPTPLVQSLQTQLRGRRIEIGEGDRSSIAPPTSAAAAAVVMGADDRRLSSSASAPSRFRWLAPVAHRAVRNRERAKSLLVGLTVQFKRAYRSLGEQFVSQGLLPDLDAVFFLLHDELGELARAQRTSPLSERAVERREVLAYQQILTFPEVSVGLPEPERRSIEAQPGDRIVGKPVSRGIVEGRVRVVHVLEEARALQPGEILVTPTTDVGWTPYFAIIGGLVTDVGSAVSHGAVVAREYGLPAVLNARFATQALRTGDRVRLDGDRGTVERLESASRFERAITALDAVNAEDPNRMVFDGGTYAKELLHAQRATAWVRALEAEPSESLLLAARAHHLRRWEFPRSEYPEGRAGYHRWRRDLQRRHASEAAEILVGCGYRVEETGRVTDIIEKRGLGRDSEVQSLEDALCLVFLETQLEGFARRHPDEKVIDIVARSLTKMSAAGRQLAGGISLTPESKTLVGRAVKRFEEGANRSATPDVGAAHGSDHKADREADREADQEADHEQED